MVTLPPLGFDEVHALMCSVVPGAMDQNLVARVAVKSGGLPGLVVPMLREARHAGRIRNVRGVWKASGELITPGLAGPLEVLLPKDQTDLEAVCLLSLAGPLDFDQARSLVGSPVLVRLERYGLLHPVETLERPVVSIFPPMLAMYLRRSLPVTQRIELQERLTAALGPGHDGDGLLASAPNGWHRTPFDAPSKMVLPQLIRERLTREIISARSVWENDPTAEHVLDYAMKLDEVGAGTGPIASALNATTPGSDPRPAAIVHTLRAMEDALASGSLKQVRHILQEARANAPSSDAELRAMEAHCTLMLGSLPKDELLADASEVDSAVGQEAIIIVRAEAACAKGRSREALDLLGALDPRSPLLVVGVQVIRGVALLLEGELDDALEAADSAFERAQAALDVHGLVANAYVAALALALGGRTRELSQHLETVLALVHVPSLQRHCFAGMLTLAVINAEARGRTEYARSLAQRARTQGPALGPFPFMWAGLTPALVAARLSSSGTAGHAREVRELALDCLSRGLLPQAYLLAVHAAELGDGAGLTAKLRAAGEAPSPALVHLLHYLDALESDDPAKVQLAADDLLVFGFEEHGRRAKVIAITMMRTRGRANDAASAALQMWRDLDGRGLDASPVLAPVRGDVDLSAREREVASMVAQGMSNQEIAQALVLSVRTVDNHVLHTYRKVGVDNREELAIALSSWLADSAHGQPLLTVGPDHDGVGDRE